MEEKPLKIELIGFDLDGKVNYLIETLETDRVYRVSFKNIPGPAATFRGSLRLKTNYTNKPEIVIPVRANFRKKIVRNVQDKGESPPPNVPKP